MSALPDYSTRRFLVVDDEEFMRSLVTRILKQLNVKEILTASDGATAVQALTKEMQPVDCILCDFNMEPVNGLMLLKAIRSGKAKAIPRDQTFIMLTGHADQDVVKVAAAMDVNGYVVKPVPADKLASSCERAFAKKITLKAPEDYAKVSLGEAETPKEDKGKSFGSVVWDRSRKEKDKWLEEKLAAIKAAAKAGPGGEKLSFKNVTTCWVKDLESGMLLAEDIETDGVLWVSAGTELNENLVSKLKEIVEGSDNMPFVKIGELA